MKGGYSGRTREREGMKRSERWRKDDGGGGKVRWNTLESC